MRIFPLLTSILLTTCAPAPEPSSEPEISLVNLETNQSGQPRFYADPAGDLYLSWIEYPDDSTDVLRFARLAGEAWSSPREIARGTDWFVNWADFPVLVNHPDDQDHLTAHWLQKRAAGTYDYDVRVTQSQDGGRTWSPSFIPHRDSIAAEHGFVSMLPLPGQGTFLTWLDGRNTKGETDEDATGHGHQGAMTLRAAVVGQNGQLSQEAELDARVCDCCQTSAALAANGPIVAYRNRSQQEIRDIYVVRQVEGEWKEPAAVHNDNWEIAGCPVNGPVVKARGGWVAVAWFTAPGNEAAVQLALSQDDGANFDVPLRIDAGRPLGRVGLAFYDDATLLLSWLEQTEEAAELRLAVIPLSGESQRDIVLANVEGSRQTGVPVIAVHNDQVYFAYTEVLPESTRVVTGKVSL